MGVWGLERRGESNPPEHRVRLGNERQFADAQSTSNHHSFGGRSNHTLVGRDAVQRSASRSCTLRSKLASWQESMDCKALRVRRAISARVPRVDWDWVMGLGVWGVWGLTLSVYTLHYVQSIYRESKICQSMCPLNGSTASRNVTTQTPAAMPI